MVHFRAWTLVTHSGPLGLSQSEGLQCMAIKELVNNGEHIAWTMEKESGIQILRQAQGNPKCYMKHVNWGWWFVGGFTQSSVGRVIDNWAMSTPVLKRLIDRGVAIQKGGHVHVAATELAQFFGQKHVHPQGPGDSWQNTSRMIQSNFANYPGLAGFRGFSHVLMNYYKVGFFSKWMWLALLVMVISNWYPRTTVVFLLCIGSKFRHFAIDPLGFCIPLLLYSAKHTGSCFTQKMSS